MFANAKRKQQSKIRQLQYREQVYRSYPILPFGIVACTFFSDKLSRNSRMQDFSHTAHLNHIIYNIFSIWGGAREDSGCYPLSFTLGITV